MDRLRRLGRDDGQTATEFIGVLAAVALVVALLAASSIAQVVRGSSSSTTCAVLNNPGCGGPGSLSPISLDPPSVARAEPADAPAGSGVYDPAAAEQNLADNALGFFRGAEDQIDDMIIGLWDTAVWGWRSATNPEQRVENGLLWQQIRADPGAAALAVWGGITEPIVAEWEAGRPGAAIGRGAVEIAGIFFGGKGLNRLRSLTAVNRADDAARGLAALADETGAIGLGGARRVVQAGGRAWDLDDLAAAGARPDRNGLTAAGRAAQKHGAREGSAFPRQSGPAQGMNASGQQILDEILGDAGSTFRYWEHPNYGDILDVRSPSGRGARYASDGRFITFIDPPQPRPRPPAR